MPSWAAAVFYHATSHTRICADRHPFFARSPRLIRTRCVVWMSGRWKGRTCSPCLLSSGKVSRFCARSRRKSWEPSLPHRLPRAAGVWVFATQKRKGWRFTGLSLVVAFYLIQRHTRTPARQYLRGRFSRTTSAFVLAGAAVLHRRT